MSGHPHRRLPPHFELSPDMNCPSEMIRGHLPSMLRSHGFGHRLPHPSSMGGDMFGSMFPGAGLSSHALMPGFNDDLMGMVPSFFGGGHSMMQSMSSMIPAGGDGVYQSSVTVMNSYSDKDGKRKVERYKKAAYGNSAKDMCEITEAYSNSATGKDIMVAERRKRNKGLQMVRERDNNANIIEECQQAIGLEDEQVDQFNNEWNDEFRRYAHGSRSAHRSLAPNENVKYRQLEQ